MCKKCERNNFDGKISNFLEGHYCGQRCAITDDNNVP